jgi:hypothetical protein
MSEAEKVRAWKARHFEGIVAGRDMTLTAKKANKGEICVQEMDTGVMGRTLMHQNNRLMRCANICIKWYGDACFYNLHQN